MQGQTPRIQSLDRGLRILEIIGAARRPVSLRELTGHLGIDRSSVFRLANTLRARGFLAYASGTKDYVLGSAIPRLGHLFPWNETLTQIARDHLVRLAHGTGETSHLAVRNRDQAFFVDFQQTGHALGVTGKAGHYEPLYCTALGKAMLSDCDMRQLIELYGNGPLEFRTERTIRTIDSLHKECERIQKRGWASDDQEYIAGIRCVGAPVRDVSGSIVAAIGISAPADRLAVHTFPAIGKTVAESGIRLSRELGYCSLEGPGMNGRKKA